MEDADLKLAIYSACICCCSISFALPGLFPWEIVCENGFRQTCNLGGAAVN